MVGRLWVSSEPSEAASISLVQRFHRLVTVSHRVGVVRQRHDRALVPGGLGDQPDLNALRLQHGDERVPRSSSVRTGSSSVIIGSREKWIRGGEPLVHYPV